MSKKGLKAKADNLKKALNEEKKAKQKKLIILLICSISALAILLIVYNNFFRQDSSETYSFQGQTVKLSGDGNFTASLAHGVRKSGTYTKRTEEGIIIVSFNISGRTEAGFIFENNLYLPEEWDDNHGHGSVFPRSK